MQQRPVIIKQATNTDAQEMQAQRLKALRIKIIKKLLKKAYPYIYKGKARTGGCRGKAQRWRTDKKLTDRPLDTYAYTAVCAMEHCNIRKHSVLRHVSA